ncbi:hypothetical protein U1Q18_049440 [Sarracenia purpurea var. burkii]
MSNRDSSPSPPPTPKSTNRTASPLTPNSSRSSSSSASSIETIPEIHSPPPSSTPEPEPSSIDDLRLPLCSACEKPLVTKFNSGQVIQNTCGHVYHHPCHQARFNAFLNGGENKNPHCGMNCTRPVEFAGVRDLTLPNIAVTASDACSALHAERYDLQNRNNFLIASNELLTQQNKELQGRLEETSPQIANLQTGFNDIRTALKNLYAIVYRNNHQLLQEANLPTPQHTPKGETPDAIANILAQLQLEGLFQEEEPQRDPPFDENTQRQPEPMNIGENNVQHELMQIGDETAASQQQQLPAAAEAVNSENQQQNQSVDEQVEVQIIVQPHEIMPFWGAPQQLGQPLTNEPPNTVNVAPAQQLLEGVRDIVSQAFREFAVSAGAQPENLPDPSNRPVIVPPIAPNSLVAPNVRYANAALQPRAPRPIALQQRARAIAPRNVAQNRIRPQAVAPAPQRGAARGSRGATRGTRGAQARRNAAEPIRGLPHPIIEEDSVAQRIADNSELVALYYTVPLTREDLSPFRAHSTRSGISTVTTVHAGHEQYGFMLYRFLLMGEDPLYTGAVVSLPTTPYSARYRNIPYFQNNLTIADLNEMISVLAVPYAVAFTIGTSDLIRHENIVTMRDHFRRLLENLYIRGARDIVYVPGPPVANYEASRNAWETMVAQIIEEPRHADASFRVLSGMQTGVRHLTPLIINAAGVIINSHSAREGRFWTRLALFYLHQL